MMSSRRSAVYLILIIYSAVYCETSSILNLFKRPPSSSHPHQRDESEPKNRRSEVVLGPAAPAAVVSVKSHPLHQHAGGSSKAEKKKVVVEESSTRATSRSGKTTDSTGRGGGWGWGGGHGHDSNLDLYSLLGGLSFASLLGATIVYLARSRNSGSSTVVMMNTTGRRRRRDLDDADEELSGESLADFMEKLGLSFSYPWWQRQDEKNNKSHSFQPFKLPLH